MDPDSFYELHRQQEAQIERDLERRLARQLRPDAAVPRRGIIAGRWRARKRRTGSPVEVLRREVLRREVLR